MNRSIREAAINLAQTAQNLGLSATFHAIDPAQLQPLQTQFDLPDALMDWYTTASPQDVEFPTIGNWIPLEDVTNLRNALLGYRYNAVSGADLPGWDATWLVIGGEPEFPVIARTVSAKDPAIYHARLVNND